MINQNEVGELKDRVVFINRVAKLLRVVDALAPLWWLSSDENGQCRNGLRQGERKFRGHSQKRPTRPRRTSQDSVLTTARFPTIRWDSSGPGVLLRPASPGTGVIAGGAAARAIVEVAVSKISLTKCIGKCRTLQRDPRDGQCLQQLRDPRQDAARRWQDPRRNQ